ncbi:MAG: hypothetical protein RBR74_04985 [Ignavibacteriaceae bacterium]|jgi:hypothetical protein|nr:hypothetical protein [Ignavibacteriaceae bacterium]
MLRFILYFLFFYILFRLLYAILKNTFSTKNNNNLKSNPVKQKTKYKDIEEAKYVEIKSAEEENK